ncbi:MAG: hypothetical protein E3K32_12305 [wastewater metagenome]|nr:hypothetical protein [Candidatus Loosdrechtia aerotolerans]
MVKANTNYQKVFFIVSEFLLCFSMFINISYGYGKHNGGGKKHMSVQLELGIELDKEAYRVEEPIKIKCSIKNVSKDMVYLPPPLFMNLIVYLKYQEGQAVPFGPKVLFSEIIKKEAIIKLQPNESYYFERIISKELYFMPNKVGQVELFVLYRNKTEDMEEIKFWNGELKSNVVTFEIK